MAYVIIGNGVAGVSAAEAIRRIDTHEPIIMISDETGLPYCRPMISQVLDGSIRPDRLPIKAGAFYQDLGIEPVLGARVRTLDPANHRVEIGTAESGNMVSVPYRKLLIASGADPRPLKVPGQELRNIFFMRTGSHVTEMIRALPGVRRGLVLGGGLVGFKAAYGLLKRGIPVTLLIRSDYPLSLQVDGEAGARILAALKAGGLDVRVNIRSRHLCGRGRGRMPGCRPTKAVGQRHLAGGSLPGARRRVQHGRLPGIVSRQSGPERDPYLRYGCHDRGTGQPGARRWMRGADGS